MTAPATSDRLCIPKKLLFALCLPALLPLLISCIRAWSAGLEATGFIQYDMAYYMANARQCFDEGFRLTYSNPYAAYGSSAIYFQPHIFLLGLLMQTGLDPGIVFNLFGLVAIAFCAVAAFLLYRQVNGWDQGTRKLGFLCFFWGGGLLSLTGLLAGLILGFKPAKAIVALDAGDGYWMFNFGRNLIYPTEAYYHGVVLIALLFVIQRRTVAALLTAALLSISHPFAGLELGLTLVAYGFVELLIRRSRSEIVLLAGAVTIVILHVSYYLVFLGRFPDHTIVKSQWELDWPYLPWTFGPALCLVGLFTLMRFTRPGAISRAFREHHTRLFAILFLVAFTLAEHDHFIKPVQPLHFTHGYDWIALFFLGLPALMTLLEQLRNISRPMLRAAALTLFFVVIWSDNLLWCATFADPSVQRYAIALTRDERDLLSWLDHHGEAPAVVISDDSWMNYLVPTYTRLRVWSGHDYNTPHSQQRKREVEAVFSSGARIGTGVRTYYAVSRTRSWTPPTGARQVYANGSFILWQTA